MKKQYFFLVEVGCVPPFFKLTIGSTSQIDWLKLKIFKIERVIEELKEDFDSPIAQFQELRDEINFLKQQVK